ncbi:hypothetical protein [Pedomonas mirosovicensis]|uniref:hypothetical protein n=1 Tax=Pedomonas mirosovicensis TaxID=2908641 RepID=UPI00216879B4|nr:hypothetical protein [Pedomonas mirosovicensis]MCH8685938.1 hypothetical protein [Pedomonas mirosovicensis]
MPEKLQFSSIVERSFAILGRNLTGAALLSIVLVGVPSVLLSLQAPMALGQPPENPLALILWMFVLFMGQNLLAGTMLYPTFRHLLGLPPAGIGLLLSYGAQLALHALVVAVAMAAIIGLGLFFFILPGVIFSLVFFVTMPVAIVERLPVKEALKRSVFLTEKNRWTLLGYQVIVWIASMLLSFFVGVVFHFVGLADVATVIVSSLVYAFTAIVTSVVYHDLRRMKEGATAEDMVRVLMQEAGR